MPAGKVGILQGGDSKQQLIQIRQINLQHAKMAQMGVGNWIDKNKEETYIFLCQEPYVHDGKAAMQPRTANIYVGGNKDTPRTAIYTSKNIPAWFIENLSNRDITTIVAKINRRETMICSIYLDSNKPVIQDWLTSIMQFARYRGYAIILAMDSNCHSELYGLETNTRGEQMEEFIGKYKLEVENKGREPTYKCTTGKSIIDITLTRGLSVSVMNWTVSLDINFSDHRTITYELKTEHIDIPATRRWAAIDWDDFRRKLEKLQIRIMCETTQARLDKCVIEWYKHIRIVLDEICPLKPNKPKDLNNPWWTDELQHLRRELNQLQRKTNQDPSDENLKKLKYEKKQYRKKCLKAKMKDWQNFNTNQDSYDSINKLRKILERKQANRLGVLTKPDNTTTNPGQDTLQYLMESHFPSCQPIGESQTSNLKIKTEEINKTQIEGITLSNIEEAIHSFKSKKSAGPDGLKPFVLKELPISKLEELLFMYKAMILLKYTPTEWTKSKVIWIPKPGKETYKVFKSWRPISLTNQPVKVLEKMIAKQADRDMKPVHDKQHGFRRNRGTESAISETVNYIDKHLANNEPVMGVFLDIQAAFDTIRPDAIKDALMAFNINPQMVEWYHSYLTKRHMITEYNGEKYEAEIGLGFPQGGVCSAKFWIIAFNEAINIINQFGALGIGFADDCCILLHRENIDHAMCLIQRIVDQLIRWGETLGLTFNPTKTVCIMFTRATDKTIKYPKRLLKIGGKEVPLSTDTRYLGVYIDSKLTWNIHFDIVVKKAKQYLCSMVNCLNKTWGPKPKLVKWVFSAVVRPRLNYGGVVWSHTINTIGKKQRLGQINRLAAMMLTPTRKKAPTAALEIIHDLMPLELFIEENALRTYCRLQLHKQSDWTTRKQKNASFLPHLKYLKKNAEEALGGITDQDSTYEIIEDKQYIVTIDSIKGVKKPILAQLNVYTDGSKTGQGAGAGFVIIAGKDKIQYTKSINLDDKASIFQAELIAITEAANYISNEYLDSRKYIKIFSDSQAALMAIKNGTCKSNTVKAAHEALNNAASLHKKLRVVWIKAHIGLDGNELADEYAKMGTIDTTTHIRTNTTSAETKKLISEFLYHKWREKWRALKKCRMTKIFYTGPDRRVGARVARLGREQMSIFIQAITGHNNLNYMNSLIIPNYTSLCRLCEEEDETFEHMYEDCPALWAERKEIRGLQYNRGQWTTTTILDFLDIEAVKEAMTTNITEEHCKK